MPWTPEEIWSTIRRARLIRILVVYFAASFAVVEGVDIFTGQAGLPDWVTSGAIVLLLIGLPIIVATALVQSSPAAAPTPAEPGREFDAFARADQEVELEERTTAADVAAVAKHWLTWRKAMLGGVLAFALLGVVTTGYTVMRVLGIGPVGSLVAKGVLDVRDHIILADFENNTADRSLGEAVTEAFRVDLEQSPVVIVADVGYVASVLSLMERDPNAPLDLASAREVAVREGIKAVIGGEINSVGGGLVLSARLVSADGGEVLASARETPRDSAEILPAIDALSKKLRERIGESLKTIRANEPLERATTSSLEALRNYAQAVRAIEVEADFEKGIALLEEALRSDTAFAMAWRKLGVAYGNVGVAEAQRVEAITKAFENRERLTERERYHTVASYYSQVSGETDRAITALRTLLDIYPDDTRALNNLANSYSIMREFGRAEEIARRALELDSSRTFHYANVLSAQFGQGKFDEAQTTLDDMAIYLPDNPWLYWYRSDLAAGREDYESAVAHVMELRERFGGSPLWRASTSWLLAKYAQTSGRIGEAERWLRDRISVDEERGLAAEYVNGTVDIGLIDVWFRGGTDRALREVESALERFPFDSMAALDRPYVFLATFNAIAGRPAEAKTLLGRHETEIPLELRRADEVWRLRALGEIAIAEGRYSDAIDDYRRAEGERDGFCGYCVLPELARAYDLDGQSDSALAIYERYLSAPFRWKYVWNADRLAFIYERLGTLYEERGDTEKAIYYYGSLVELWQDADPVLQPRVDAARRAIAALSTDRS